MLVLVPGAEKTEVEPSASARYSFQAFRTMLCMERDRWSLSNLQRRSEFNANPNEYCLREHKDNLEDNLLKLAFLESLAIKEYKPDVNKVIWSCKEVALF